MKIGDKFLMRGNIRWVREWIIRNCNSTEAEVVVYDLGNGHIFLKFVNGERFSFPMNSPEIILTLKSDRKTLWD